MNLLSAEAEILARLGTVSVSGETPLVLSAPDLEEFSDRPRRVPAVALVYAGVTVQQGTLMVFNEHWITWVIVRNVRSTASGQPARADAGPWLDAIAASLIGFAPTGYDPMRPNTPPKSGYLNGYAYHALAWDVPHQPIYCEV